jgi:FxsC-like protein
VVGAESDYAAVRTNRAGYGSAGYEWQPYHPDAQMVGAIATTVVSSNGLFPDVLHVSKQLTENLEIAEKKNTMVLIIVDPWTARINTFRQVFDAVDRLRLSNCGVIIPWNEVDPTRNTTKGKALRTELAMLLSRIWDSKDIFFIKKVPSEDQFRLAINNAVKEIQARISDRGRLLRGESSEDDFPMLPPGTANTQRPAA